MPRSSRALLGAVIAVLLFASSAQATSTVLYTGDSTANDANGVYNGTWSGTAKYTTDRNGVANSAFDFDGNNGISASSAASEFGANDWTVSFWLQVASSGTQYQVIGNRLDCGASTTAGFSARFQATVYGAGIETWTGGGSSPIGSGSGPITDGLWHQITYTRTGGTVYVGVDGVSKGTHGGSGAMNPATGPLKLAMGNCAGSPDGTVQLKGAMDDVRLVNGEAAPLITSSATVSGTTTDGQTLSAASYAFAGSAYTTSYSWQQCDTSGNSCGSPVGISSSYLLGASDVGKRLKLSVTASNGAGVPSTTTALSNVIAPAAPTVSASSNPTHPQGLPQSTDPRTTVAFAFASSTSGATYQCKLDGAAFSACTSPNSVTGLANGSHTFSVQAVKNGATSAAAQYTWTTDTTATVATTAPAVADISSPNDTGINVTSGQRLKVTASGTWACGNSCPSGPDGGTYSSTDVIKALPYMALMGRIGGPGNPWFLIGSGPTLVKGSGELYLAANDSFNGDNQLSLNVTIAPTSADVSITSGAISGTQPTAPANNALISTGTLVRFGFTGTSGSTFSCAYNTGVPVFTTCTSPDDHTYSVGTGTGAFRVRATAPGGEQVIAAAPLWTVTSGTSPAAPTINTPASYERDTTAPTITFTGGSTTSECKIDGGSWATCSTGDTLPGFSSLTVGSHALAVRTIDNNGSMSAAATSVFVKATPAATPKPQIVTSSMTQDTAYNANTAGTIGSSDLRGSSFDASGNLWVPNLEPNKLHEYGSTGAPVSPFPISAGDPNIGGPMDVEVDKDGNVWLLRWVSNGLSSLEKRNSSGTVLATYKPSGVGTLQSVGSDPITGILYLTNGSALYRFDPATTTFTQVASGLSNAWDVAVGTDGVIYVTDLALSQVDRFKPTGESLGSFTTASQPRHSQLVGGVLYFAAQDASSYAYGVVDGSKLLTLSSSVNGTVVNGAPWWAGADSAGRVYTAGYSQLTRDVVSTLGYTENDAATSADPQVSVTDAAASPISSATVTINGYAGSEDALSFTNNGTTMGNVAVSSNTSGVLTLTSAGSTATFDQWSAALRAVKYANSSDAPNTGARTVQFSVTDANGQTSTTFSRPLTVTAVNDAPVAPADHNAVDPSNPGAGATTLTYGAPVTAANIEVDPTLSDPDSSAPTQMRIKSIPAGATLKTADGTTTLSVGSLVAVSGGHLDLRFTPGSAADATITYTVVDSANSSLESSPASKILVDVIPDAPALTNKPTTSQNTSDARTSFPFKWTAGQAQSFKCKLDNGSYTTCTSPKYLTGLSSGQHTFSVESVDTDGDVNETSWTWTVDPTQPSSQSVVGNNWPTDNPQNAPTSANALGADTGIAVDPTHPVKVSATGTWSGGPATPYGPRGTGYYLGSGLAPYLPLYSLIGKVGNGPWFEIGDGPTSVTGTGELYLSQNDCSSAGCFSDNSGSLNVTIAPTTMTASVDSSPAGGSTTGGNVRFTFSGTESKSGQSVASYRCSIDGGATFSATACSSPDDESFAPNGQKQFAVKAISTSGESVISHSQIWNVNTALNVATPTITSGPANNAPVNSAPTYGFSSSTGGVSYECKVDTGTWTSCTSPKTVSGQADGSHSFSVRAYNSAGTVSGAASRNFFLDTVAPSKPTLGQYPDDLSKDPNPSFTSDSTDPSPSSGALSYTCTLNAQSTSCPGGDIAYSHLADGDYTFTVTATDPAGNTSAVRSWSFRIDQTGPTASVVRPAEGARYSTTQTVTASYTCSDTAPGTVTLCSADVDGTPVADGTQLPTTAGDHTFTLSMKDNSGNTGTVVRHYKGESFAQIALDDDPLAYYRLGDGPGASTFSDSSTHLHDGEFKNDTESEPQGVSGDHNTARHFKGSQGYGYANGIAAPVYESTLITWVRFDEVRDSDILDHGYDNGLYLTNGHFAFRHMGTTIVDPGASVVANRWYMVVGRWNGKTMDLFVADQTQSKYQAPTKVATAVNKKRASGQSTFYLGFGEDQPWLKGSLDEVMYFSRAISDAHIAELWLADPPANVEEAAATVQPAPETPAASSESTSTPAAAPSAPKPVAVASKPGKTKLTAKQKAAAKAKALARKKAKAKAKALARKRAQARAHAHRRSN